VKRSYAKDIGAITWNVADIRLRETTPFGRRLIVRLLRYLYPIVILTILVTGLGGT
jgi:hypothetical protein